LEIIFGCIWFSRLHLTDFSIFFKRKLWFGECERECNSARAILSVGDMAKYEVVEIVAKLLNFPTHTKQYHTIDIVLEVLALK
jgi:hypothetical protein